MDSKIDKLVMLIDEAIEMAEGRMHEAQVSNNTEEQPEALERIISGLHYRRGEAVSGKLYPSEGRNTLGLLRNIVEYEPTDSPLAEKAREIERYYQTYI